MPITQDQNPTNGTRMASNSFLIATSLSCSAHQLIERPKMIRDASRHRRSDPHFARGPRNKAAATREPGRPTRDTHQSKRGATVALVNG